MKIFKELLKKLKNPSAAVVVVSFIILAAAVSGVALVIVFNAPPYVQYLLYLLSAVSLAYFIYLVVLLCIKVKPRMGEWAEKYSFTRRLKNDYNFRTMIFAACAFIINIAYAAFNIAYGIIFNFNWNVAIGVYYIVLGALRGIVVDRTRRTHAAATLTEEERIVKKIKIYRLTGCLLFVLTAALNVMLWLMIDDPDTGFRYRGLLIFVMAAYTVYKLILAIYNLVKVRSSDDFAVHAVRNINLTTALVSVLALQTAMIAAFNEGEFPAWSTSALGTAICAFVFGLGIYMIIKSTRALNNKGKQKADNE